MDSLEKLFKLSAAKTYSFLIYRFFFFVKSLSRGVSRGVCDRGLVILLTVSITHNKIFIFLNL